MTTRNTMQAAPHDGQLFCQARAATTAIRASVKHELWCTYLAACNHARSVAARVFTDPKTKNEDIAYAVLTDPAAKALHIAHQLFASSVWAR